MKKTDVDNQITEFMLKRRSVLVKNMTAPGSRSLSENREPTAKIKADCYPDLLPEQLQIEKNCFSRAPLIICVVYSPVEHKTPKFEQLLSTGAVCQHINIAAAALGFVSQWITGWTADHQQCQQHLGLAEHESVAAYLSIGS
ncbi:MAG: nitroreductase family protein, partial [Proteobacteria bacterium]|nr:nitroreductase family protein [Pseudomonadota bacterium]